MPAPTKHHPQGPSRQKNIAGPPEGNGCCGFQQTQNDHVNKRLGNVCHEIWDTGDRKLADGLPDPDFALLLVDKIQEKWDALEYEFKSECGLIHTRINEVFLDAEGINFGTADRLRITDKAALIGDAKFGEWKVDAAPVNLQGHNYAVLVWDTYPQIEDIWVWFGNPRLDDYTLAKFTRSFHYPRFKLALLSRLYNAKEADPANFNYNEINCGFCARLDCPVRLDVATKTLEYLRDNEVETMNNEELASIKSLANSLKTFTKLVDNEATTRLLDDGETLTGFEPQERVRSREVIGWANISKLRDALNARDLYLTYQRLDDILTVAFSDVEELIADELNDNRTTKQTISEILEVLRNSKALTENKYYAITTKKN